MSAGVRTTSLPRGTVVEIIGHIDAGGTTRTIGRQSIGEFVNHLLDLAGMAPSELAEISGKLEKEISDRLKDRGDLTASLQEVSTILTKAVYDLRKATVVTTALKPLPTLVEQALARIGLIEARPLEIRVTGERLEYRVPGTPSWKTVLQIPDITGAAGRDGADLIDLTPRNRPGDSPHLFSPSLAGGDIRALPGLPAAWVAVADGGRVARLPTGGVVRSRRYVPVEPGRAYVARFAVRRSANATDPSNDTVRCGLLCLDQAGSAVGTVIVRDFLDLTTAQGRREVVKVAAASNAAGVDVVFPERTRYACAFVQAFGGAQGTDIEVVDLVDLTDGALLSADLSAFEARMGAQESYQAGARLDAIEAAVGNQAVATYASRAVAAGSQVPASAQVLRVLGGDQPGDRRNYLYRRSAGVPSDGFISADGAVWERVATEAPRFTGVGRVERLKIGFGDAPVYAGALAVGVDWASDAPTIIVPDGHQLDFNELRQTFTLRGSSRASWFNFVIHADANSHENSNVYPGIGILINDGAGTVKGFYSRVEIGRANSGGVAIARVGGVTDRAGSNFTAGDQCSIDNEDAAKPVNVGYWLHSNKYFHDKAQLDHGLLGSIDIEVQQAFVQCFAGGPGNFASLISADGKELLYSVDRFGNVNARNVQARSGLKIGGPDGEGVIQFLRAEDSVVAGQMSFDPETQATVFDNALGLGYHSFVVNGVERWRLDKDSLAPGLDAAYTLGTATKRPSTIFSATPTIATSDQRYKADQGDVPAAVLRAWGRVRTRFFQFKDAVAEKGADKARLHIGLYAQEVEAAFRAEGLDPWRYALLCRDPVFTTVERTRTVTRRKMETVTVDHVETVVEGGTAVRRVVPREVLQPVVEMLPLLDADGGPVMESYVDGYDERQVEGRDGVATTVREPVMRRRPAMHAEPVMEEVEEPYREDVPSGEDRLGLRYEACLVLEAAWLRAELAGQAATISNLAARLAAVESRAG